jgi:PAS domain S-box-containing protein
MALFDRDMRYLAASRRWLTDYGLDGQDLIGRSHYEVFPDLPARWKESHRRALGGEAVQSDEDRFDRAGGKTQWLRWDLRPWYDADGRVGGVLLHTEDVTARRQAEEALRKERDFSQAIINTVQMVVLLLDPDGRVLRFNPYFERLTGWRLDEVRGRNWFDTFLPEDHRPAVRAVFHRAIGGEPTRGNVNPVLMKGGGCREVEWHDVQLHDPDGRLIGLLSVGQDVTERRQADDELRHSIALRRQAEDALRERQEALLAILDAATDAVISIDDAGTIRELNAATARLFGYPADELLGRNVSDLMPPPYREEHDGYIARYLRTGEKRIIGAGREVVARRKDGTTFPIELSVREAAGPPRRFVGFVRDLTDRKELEARFLRAQRLESIGTLASGIAHDLNNVLTPVLVAVKLLLRDRPGVDRQALLETAQASIERGAGMIRQLLTFGGGMAGERVPVAVGGLVREVRGLLGHTFPKAITFAVAVAGDAWPVVGDPTQLTQVLVNLCVNGRDAMPAGGTLTIRVENHELDPERAARHPGARPGRYVCVSVSDTGTGMTPEVQARIFDPFFTTKPFGQGTGLGLATAQGIVKSHGGFIGVDSEPENGTQFSVYLPAADRGPATPADPAAAADHHGGGRLVLVVDDEPAVRVVARAALEAAGYRVATADGGQAAVEWHARHHPEVAAVVLDMMMPGLAGPAVIARLRATDPAARVLAVSGLRPAGRDADLLTAERVAFLPKPYSDDDLVAAVATLLRPAP